MSSAFMILTRGAVRVTLALALAVVVSLSARAQAPVGERPDVYSFTSAQRTLLYNLMKTYISAPVVQQHLDPPSNKHGSSRFAVWHRRYIGDMEQWLVSQGHSEFVPLPRWDPSTPIPSEFTSGGGVDPDCASLTAYPGSCTALANTNPGIILPLSLSSNLCTQVPFTTFRSTLENYHNTVHGTISGVMGNYKSPSAPIFWLWHGWVDDIWFDWQCACGLDEGSAFDTYDNTERATNLVAGKADAWMKDSPNDMGFEPNGTGDPLWNSQDIWCRNAQDTFSGPPANRRYIHEHQHENPEYSSIPANTPYIYVKVRNRGCQAVSGTVHVYFANATIGFLWNSTYFTEVLPAASLTSIGGGKDQVAELHWTNIPAPTSTDHYCLVARFEASPTSADPINGEIANADVGISVSNSNQFIQRNVTVVDNVANKWVVLRNISNLGTFVDLHLNVPTIEANDSFFDHGRVLIDLGTPLFNAWVQQGAQGTGIEYNTCGQILVLGAGATINHIPMAYLEAHPIAVAFQPGSGAGAAPCESDRTVFNVELSGYQGATLLGGETYEVHPWEILPSPPVTITALDPINNCVGGTVRLQVTSNIPPGAALQWLKDDMPVPGATQTVYAAPQTGVYKMQMTYTNGCSRTSDGVLVHVGTPPPNDNPCNALTLVLGVPADYDNYCATAQAGEVSPGAGSDPLGGCFSRDGWCASDSLVQNSLWYKFVAPAGGIVSIRAGMPDGMMDHTHVSDTQLAVYQVGNCGNYSTYSLVAANDNSGDEGMWGTDPALNDLAGLTPGAVYYVQLDGYNGTGGMGMIVVEAGVSDVPVGPAASQVPGKVEFASHTPNPSNGRFEIRLGLPQALAVDLRLIDVGGREVARRSYGTLEAGYHDLSWNAAGGASRISHGVYFLEARAGAERKVWTMVLR